MSTITERVTAGMALLDDKVPGWEHRIDLDRLDVRSKCQCVLGQEFGHFGSGIRILNLSGADATRYGFDIDAAKAWSFPAAYRALTAAWDRLIHARLADQAQATGSEGR